MTWQRETESEQHQARRIQEHKRFRLGMGVSHVEPEVWEDLDARIDKVFENEQAQIEETEQTETIEPERKIAVLQINEDLIKSAIIEGSERSNTIIANKKIRLLNAIETEFAKRMEDLDAQILEVENQKKELKALYEKAQVEFVNDRIKERERYAKELDSWFSKVYNTILNFADSPTEQTLVCLYNKNVGSSIVSLSGILSSKKIISKDEIKISGGD